MCIQITVTKAAVVVTLGVFAFGELRFPLKLANDPYAPQPDSFELATTATSSTASFIHSSVTQDMISGEIIEIPAQVTMRFLQFPTDVSSGSTVPRR